MGSDTGPGHGLRGDGESGPHLSAPGAASAGASGSRQVFDGEERQLAVMRRWLTSLLPECPARDDVLSVATELASNALLHTASGNGGWFAVEVTWLESAVRVGVADGGGPAEPHVIEDPGGEHGRGLLLVHGLSLRTGVTGDRNGRLVWADVAWDGPHPTVSPAPLGLDEAAIRDGEAALARRFAGVPAWFGRSTRAWWALASPTELVTAPTAPELAALLYRLLSTVPRADAADDAQRDELTQRYGLPDAPRRRSAQGTRSRPGAGFRYTSEHDRPDDRRRTPGSPPGWPLATAWPRSAASSGF